MTRRLRIAPLVCALALFVGCATHSGVTAPPPPHAGAANAFDSATWDALVTIQAGIEKAKTVVTPDKKALLNQVISVYNKAERTYEVYHSAAIAGTATPAQQAELQTQVDQLKTNFATLGSGK